MEFIEDSLLWCREATFFLCGNVSTDFISGFDETDMRDETSSGVFWVDK